MQNKLIEKISTIWRDPVWSKVIAYCIIGLISLVVSGLYTYFRTPTDTRKEESVISVLLSYNLTVNLFVIISVVIFFVLISIGFLYKNYCTKYDLFISAPMSGFQNEQEYFDFRKICLQVKDALEEKCGFKKIYYAGDKKPNKKSFSIPRVAFLKDLSALRNSKRFLLIHPGKIFSSTIFECGYAYRKQTKSLYFVRNLHELPFLMRQLADAASFVSIICVEDMENIVNVINNDKVDIF